MERRKREYFQASYGDPCGPENRFLVEGLIGTGSFSTVFRCKDTKAQDKKYAIKFVRTNESLLRATELEVKLMRRLRSQASEKDPEGARCFLALAGPETFMHEGHLALIFHLQKCDMKTALTRCAKGQGFTLFEIRRFARDVFLALRALRAIRIIHSDLKPDNLLLSLDGTSVKLSDFGCAIDLAEPKRRSFVKAAYLSSYRAPEIVLGKPFSTRADIWSAGVTFYELATGRALFLGKTNNELLNAMLSTCGAFTRSFANAGKSAARHFTVEGDFRRKRRGPGGEEAEDVVPMSQFAKPALGLAKRIEDALQNPRGAAIRDHQGMVKGFADLLLSCVVPDPAGRASPEAVLGHSFLKRATAEKQ